MSSLSARTAAAFRAEGYEVATVEHWNAWARKRQDLFGCYDLLAVGQGHIVFVQVTSDSNASSRRQKILGSTSLEKIRSASGIICLATWRKVRNRWVESREYL